MEERKKNMPEQKGQAASSLVGGSSKPSIPNYPQSRNFIGIGLGVLSSKPKKEIKRKTEQSDLPPMPPIIKKRGKQGKERN